MEAVSVKRSNEEMTRIVNCVLVLVGKHCVWMSVGETWGIP